MTVYAIVISPIAVKVALIMFKFIFRIKLYIVSYNWFFGGVGLLDKLFGL